MAEISNINGVASALPTRTLVSEGAAKPAPYRTRTNEAAEDQVEFSDVGLKLAQELPGYKAERIAQLRQEISDGTFESDARLQGTIDRLLEVLLK